MGRSIVGSPAGLTHLLDRSRVNGASMGAPRLIDHNDEKETSKLCENNNQKHEQHHVYSARSLAISRQCYVYTM